MTRDILEAAILLLKADADLQVLVDTRVFGEELPGEEASSMPRPAVVLRHAPGLAGPRGYVELEVNNFDVFCYGTTPAQAEEVRRAVYSALKHARRQAVAETLIHSFDQVGTIQSLRDPDTQWPYSLSSWRSLASEKQAT